MSIIEIIKIPQDNVNDTDVTISNIYGNQNDLIDKDTLIIDYETSKANFEICVSKKGYVQFNCAEGDIIQIGHVVALYLRIKSMFMNLKIN